MYIGRFDKYLSTNIFKACTKENVVMRAEQGWTWYYAAV